MKDHNIDRLVDALQRLTIEVQLFREAFVANNMSICESCSNNPCNKKVMLGDRRILECTMYDRKTENSSEKPNNCECEPRKEQNFCGKCRYLYRDFKYGLSCYRLMDNEPCKYEERKDEPQTERSE